MLSHVNSYQLYNSHASTDRKITRHLRLSPHYDALLIIIIIIIIIIKRANLQTLHFFIYTSHH